MTSINAIRFDHETGAMVCDEQRHWNPERMKMYAADKIRAIVPLHIRELYKVAAAYGNTGTSTIGDELRLTIYREVESIFDKKCQELGKAPDQFLSIDEIARVAWKVICRLKHAHVDQSLRHKFGFSTSELINGAFTRNGREFKIQNELILREALDCVAPDPSKAAPDAVFGNGGIVAGCDPENGFKIFNLSMNSGFIEPAEAGYVALGSGGDATNFILPRFFNQQGVSGRLTGVDRLDGIIALVDAVNMASEHNLGVGGYFNLIFFDLNQNLPNKFYFEVNDHRSKLISETIRSHRANLISESVCREIVGELLFDELEISIAEKKLWESSSDQLRLHRILRGYPS